MLFAASQSKLYPTMHYSSIGSIAKLGQKDDIYSRIFNQIDKDKNGTLDREEFSDATSALNLCLTEKELTDIYESIASDNAITLDSFKKFVEKSVCIHKQFTKFRREFTTVILNKTTQSLTSNQDLFIESPTYQFIFSHAKLTELQQININLPLLSDTNNNECFLGYIRIISVNHKTTNINITQEIETKNMLQNLIPYSQIITINNINCESIGYEQIINIINETSLPHTIIFRKTVGIAIDNNNNNTNTNSDMDTNSVSISCTNDDILSIPDSEKYVVCDKSPPAEGLGLNIEKIHCKYCPNKLRHEYLLALHRTFEDETYNKLSFCIITYIMILIILSTITYILETMPEVQSKELLMKIMFYIEWIVSISFSIEYIMRIIACNNRFKYFIDIMNMIDFLAVIPFWIELMSGSASTNILRVIRIIRLARIIRLMKSDRFIEYLHVFTNTIKRSSESFGLLSTLILLQVILFGSLFYVIEAETNVLFSSIPMGAFYTVVTITTVGYGDMIPITILGRIVAIFCMFLGLLIVALPVIIIGGNFEKEYRSYIENKQQQKIINKAKELNDLNRSLNNKRVSRKDEGFAQVYQFLMKINKMFEKDIFIPEDAHILCKHGINSEQRLLQLLYNERGYAFYPEEIKKSKIFVLHELYGSRIRRIKLQKDTP
eukprot:236018_1